VLKPSCKWLWQKPFSDVRDWPKTWVLQKHQAVYIICGTLALPLEMSSKIMVQIEMPYFSGARLSVSTNPVASIAFKVLS